MASLLPRRAGFVCDACRTAQKTPRLSRSFSNYSMTASSSQTASKRRSPRFIRLSEQRRTQWRASSTATAAATGTDFKDRVSRNVPVDPQQELAELRQASADIVDSDEVPGQEVVHQLLNRMHKLARHLIYTEDDSGHSEAIELQPQSPSKSATQAARNTSSALLQDLDENKSASFGSRRTATANDPEFAMRFRREATRILAETAYNLIRDPKVNITRPGLRTYTLTQCLLAKPEYLPEIFDLFVHKPRAEQSSASSPIRFRARRMTWSTQSAIPLDLANVALSAAIHKRDMGLAVAITDTTVGTSAYRTQRFMQKAFPTCVAVSVFPYTVNTIANWAATYQNTFEPSEARNMALAVGMAYVGTFGSIAFVAATTWSDHHERVHWQPGAGLAYRWLRQDERGFMDKIAQAWGFEDKKRRGEEIGPEWDALRDTIGLKSMVLDKTEFMPGFS